MYLKNHLYTAFLLSFCFWGVSCSTAKLQTDQQYVTNLQYSHVHNASAPSSFIAAPYSLPESAKTTGLLTLGAGIEYGNVDNIFDFIDYVDSVIEGEEGEEGEEGDEAINLPELPDAPENLPTNPTFQDIIDNNPEVEQWIDQLEDRSTFIAASLAVIAEEAYAKAFISTDLPLGISDNFLGGSLSFSATASRASKALGIADEFEFDKTVALDEIQNARQLTPEDPETIFFLSDDLAMIINPAAGTVEFDITNDSLLLVKASEIQKFSLNYTREAYRNGKGILYWAVRPSIYSIGLTQLDVRFGQLSDSQALFDDIRNSEFKNSERLSVDLGVLWQAENYSLGATLRDPFSPEFSFPDLQNDKYSNAQVLRRLRQESTYEMEPQLQFMGSYFTTNGRWRYNFHLDANSSPDPMGDEYQWLVLSTSYKSQSKWLPDWRLGYRSDLKNSDLQYIGFGLDFLQVVSLDLSAMLDTITYDGKTLPRGMNGSLGVNFAF